MNGSLNGAAAGRGGRYEGKVALITGGGSGIGAAIAEQFASEGASTVICGRRREVVEAKAAELRSCGYDALAVACDVAAEAERVVQTTVERFGRLDVLVNNAATASGRGLDELAVDEWRRVMATNLDAAFALVAAARPHLLRSRGSVLHISSIGAVAGYFDDLAYASSKAGLEGFSRRLALELADAGVRSNVVRPGLILTEAFAGMPDAFFESQVPLIPLGRIGRPQDIAHAAAFLCSDEANFITGAVLTVDGGESAK